MRLGCLSLIGLCFVISCGGSSKSSSTGSESLNNDPLIIERLSSNTGGERWYQDSNLGVSGELPLDFFSRMSELGTWKDARNTMSVYFLRVNSYHKHLRGNHALLNELATLFNDHNIVLAIDETAPTWAHSDVYQKDLSYKRSIETIKELKDYGFRIKYISLQSVLSKPLRVNSEIIGYPISSRFKDVSSYLQALKPIYPELNFGLIDALPSHVSEEDYKKVYSELVAYLQELELEIDFIHADVPMNLLRNNLNNLSYSSVKTLQTFVQQDLNLKFGFFITDMVGGNQSSDAFKANILHGLENILKGDIEADMYVFSSWFDYPNYTEPDNLTESPATGFSTFTAVDALLNQYGDFNPKHCIYDVYDTAENGGKIKSFPGYRNKGEIGGKLFRTFCFDSEDKHALYYCKKDKGELFVSTDNECEGYTPTEPSLIGYVLSTNNAEGELQSIKQCEIGGDFVITSTSSLCDNNTTSVILGYTPQ